MMNQPTNKRKINWPDLVFTAEAEREWFEDVTITTLKSEYAETVYEQAWNQADTSEGLEDRAKAIMDSGVVRVNEYIQIGENYSIKICIDREEITDEVVEEALDLLIGVGLGIPARLKIGGERTFTSEQVTPKLH